MNNRRLYQIGLVVALLLLILQLTGGQAHAFCLLWWCWDPPPVPAPHSVPEIDAGMAVSGVTLLIASTLVLVERFRR